MKGRARMILLGCSALRFNLSEAIAERNAFNCECERHDLLARKMQGHDVCFAAVTRLRTFLIVNPSKILIGYFKVSSVKWT